MKPAAHNTRSKKTFSKSMTFDESTNSKTKPASNAVKESFSGSKMNKILSGKSIRNLMLDLPVYQKTPSHKKLNSSLKPSVQIHKPLNLAPNEVISLFGHKLSQSEEKEMLSYPRIYYLSLRNSKDFDPKKTFPPKTHLAYRYEIKEKLGEGTYSEVYSAIDHKEKKSVAIKAIKPLPRFYEQSFREIEILNGLARAYKNKSYSVELLEHFNFRGQKFLVFDLLSKSLYQHIKHDLTLQEILNISFQLLSALSQIHKKSVIHCDLKTENIMFSPAGKLKLIDFGTACLTNESYHNIQTRYYRAPEVILGCKYSTAVDVWSAGCTIVEMLCGKPPFLGEDTHQQLLSIIEYKGSPPLSLIQHAPMRKEFFFAMDQAILRPDSNGSVKVPSSKSLRQLVTNELLLDLVEKCLEWDPVQRISATSALKHPVFHHFNNKINL